MNKNRVLECIIAAVVLLAGARGAYSVIEMGLSEFDVTDVRASSVLVEKGKPANYYVPGKAFDNNADTAWCQGNKNGGIGEYIEVKFKPVLTSFVYILNGYGANRNLYESNNRIKDYEVTVTFKDGTTMVKKGKLNDNKCLPRWNDDKNSNYRCRWLVDPDYDDSPDTIVDFGSDNLKCVTGIKIKILSVYPGKRFTDTCIAEIGPIWNGAWATVVPGYRPMKKKCCGTDAD